jgi:probable FeS assembly SUF system protein SufT
VAPDDSPAAADDDHEGPPEEDKIWEQLKTVFDPEIPVNIVDLGLVYNMAVQERDEGGHAVHVDMTLTAPGCGMGPVIAEDAKQKVITVPGVRDAQVEIVWDPPWNPQMISEEGRKLLDID